MEKKLRLKHQILMGFCFLLSALEAKPTLLLPLRVDFETYFVHQNVCVLCDCDGVLTQSQARETLDWQNLSSVLHRPILEFLQKDVLPSQKMLTFCSAFHNQKDDEESLQNTKNLISQIFQCIGLNDPKFGPIHKLVKNDLWGFFSFSTTYPQIHVLSIKKAEPLAYFTQKEKAPLFHELCMERGLQTFDYLPTKYLFIDDNIRYYPDDARFFCYKENGHRAFCPIQKATGLCRKELSSCIDYFCQDSDPLYQASNFAMECQQLNAKTIIFLGRSPQYLRYCLELLRDDSLNRLFQKFFPDGLKAFAEVQKYLQNINLLPIPFSGVPLDPQKHLGSDRRFSQIKDSESHPHYVFKSNIYTEKGLEIFKNFLKNKLEAVQENAHLVVVDAMTTGGGMGLFFYFLQDALSNKNVKIYCSSFIKEKNDKTQNCFYSEKNNLLKFHLKSIQPHLPEELIVHKGPWFKFGIPFDHVKFENLVDVSSFYPCDWENGYQLQNAQKGILQLKEFLPMIFFSNPNLSQVSIFNEPMQNIAIMNTEIDNHFNHIQACAIEAAIKSIEGVFFDKTDYLQFRNLVEEILTVCKAEQHAFFETFKNLKNQIESQFLLSKFQQIKQLYQSFQQSKNQLTNDLSKFCPCFSRLLEIFYTSAHISFLVQDDDFTYVRFKKMLSYPEENTVKKNKQSDTFQEEILKNMTLRIQDPFIFFKLNPPKSLEHAVKQAQKQLPEYEAWHQELRFFFINQEEAITVETEMEQEIALLIQYQSNEAVNNFGNFNCFFR